MNEKTFNKKKEELLANIDKAETLGEKILALDRFQYFMRTKSHNGHWNPKYRKNSKKKGEEGRVRKRIWTWV